ncbi:MAG: threonine aldolase [Gemmatimonadetes bacterium]|nr:threonine aldolase [Gemmatimonadota bacterium]
MTPTFEDRRHFYSDNLAGTHPAVLQAIADANVGHSLAYGEDPLTAEAIARVCQLFGGDGVEAHFVFNGTAANVLCAAAVTAPFQAVLCSETSHIQWDECGAIERFVGCRVLALPSVGGKLTPDCLDNIAEGHAEPHQSKPRLLSITQVTEMGTLYTPEEVKALAAAAHDRGWLLHMDGARLANAAAFLELPPRAFTVDAGVDLLSLGLTKTGAMMAEAVVMFGEEASRSFPYVRKQGLQLASKMRFISAQFLAMLTDDLWLQLAGHANEMAQRLRVSVQDIPGVELVHPTQGNGVFVRLAPDRMRKLLAEVTFAVWDPQKGEARWMTAWDTTAADVDAFAETVRQIMTPR